MGAGRRLNQTRADPSGGGLRKRGGNRRALGAISKQSASIVGNKAAPNKTRPRFADDFPVRYGFCRGLRNTSNLDGREHLDRRLGLADQFLGTFAAIPATTVCTPR